MSVHSLRCPLAAWLIALVSVMPGCTPSTPSSGSSGSSTCPDGMHSHDDGCVDPVHPYEPALRLDHNNVVNYGAPLQKLQLPPPPKSGFRLVLSSVTLKPGEDIFYCNSWRLPETVHKHIYAAELHTTAGLHHGNMYASPINPETGPQPYPRCHPGAAGHLGDAVKKAIGGKFAAIEVPDVMFANTTQLVGSEAMRFPAGYAYAIKPGREVVIDAHLLNPTSEPLLVEVVYDYYTMPAELVTNAVAPFVYFWLDFQLPAQAASSLTATCDWYGGEVVGVMPHMHEWGKGFEVDFLDAQNKMVASPYHGGKFTPGETQMQPMNPPVSTNGASKVRFSCHYQNTTDHPMCNGVGENEMCFLFGYMSPPPKQGVGIVPTQGAPCLTISGYNPANTPIDLEKYIAGLAPAVRARLLDLFGGKITGGSTCPELSP